MFCKQVTNKTKLCPISFQSKNKILIIFGGGPTFGYKMLYVLFILFVFYLCFVKQVVTTVFILEYFLISFQGLRLICTASESSYAFRVLCEREAHGTNIHIQNVVGFAHSDRECIVRHYLSMYGKALDESAFNNLMLQLVTKKDSGTPLYLRIACDFLRTYASFENVSWSYFSFNIKIATFIPMFFYFLNIFVTLLKKSYFITGIYLLLLVYFSFQIRFKAYPPAFRYFFKK